MTARGPQIDQRGLERVPTLTARGSQIDQRGLERVPSLGLLAVQSLLQEKFLDSNTPES